MQAQNVERFYRFHAHIYDLTRPLFLLDRAQAIDRLAVQKQDIIFDYACGTGLNIRMLLKKMPPTQLYGVDYAQAMLNVAQRKYPNVHFRQADITQPLADVPPADKIISAYALTMIPDWQKAIQMMVAHLKPGGRLVLLDFYAWDHNKSPRLYPLFQRWMELHGVDLTQNIPSFFEEKFPITTGKLHFTKLRSGYNYIAVFDKAN